MFHPLPPPLDTPHAARNIVEWVIVGQRRTRGQGLLELVGLLGVLQDESVDETLAADLELDLLALAVALDPGGCSNHIISFELSRLSSPNFFLSIFPAAGVGDHVQEASFRRQISMNCLISETSRGMVTG